MNYNKLIALCLLVLSSGAAAQGLNGTYECANFIVASAATGQSKELDNPWGEVTTFELDGSVGRVVYATGKTANVVLHKSVDGEVSYANTYKIRGGDQLNSVFIISVEHDSDTIGFAMQLDMADAGQFVSAGKCR